MNTCVSEKQHVCDLFLNAFAGMKHTPMVLYGIGANTYYILKHVEGFNIVGLMDQENTGKEIYGLPVLSKDEVIKSAKSIVIIARAAVIPIIHARIADLTANHRIDIYDIGGTRLLPHDETLAPSYDNDWADGEPELRSAIDNADIVSFDIYDTLVMRSVLRPQNVFDITERCLAHRHGIHVPFAASRIQAEQAAAERYESPGIEQIYGELMRLLGISQHDKALILQEELATESRLTVPRSKMVQLFEYALKRGKTVYLISDMYFGKKQLSTILTSVGIDGYKDLLVSCEIGKTKRSGKLFEHYLGLEPNGTHLHIGNDAVADIERPREHGLRAFPIKSGYDMLVSSAFSHLLSHVGSYSDAVALGLFVARAFNNPFALHETKGKLVIDNEYDIGYLGYGAMLTGFMRWMLGLVKGRIGAKLLFGARDGYLIAKLYQLLIEAASPCPAPQGVYFLTSRRAVTVASIYNRGDIEEILGSIGGSPTYSEVLDTRFGVSCDASVERAGERLDREHADELKAFVLGFEQRILNNARSERLSYLRYAASLGIGACDKVYVYDLISSGTIPYLLGKILGKEVECLCFIASAPVKYDLKGNQHCYLGMESPYSKVHNFFMNHYLNESIMTAPFPEFSRIGEDGEPCYDHSDDSHSRFDKVKMTQDGIEAYFRAFLAIEQHVEFEPISVRLADGMNGIFESRHCEVAEGIKQSYVISDKHTFMPTVNALDTLVKTA